MQDISQCVSIGRGAHMVSRDARTVAAALCLVRPIHTGGSAESALRYVEWSGTVDAVSNGLYPDRHGPDDTDEYQTWLAFRHLAGYYGICPTCHPG